MINRHDSQLCILHSSRKNLASSLFSDSGVESGTTGQGDQESPSLELAIQRLAETIKEFDTHGHSREEDEDEPGSNDLKTGKTGFKNALLPLFRYGITLSHHNLLIRFYQMEARC